MNRQSGINGAATRCTFSKIQSDKLLKKQIRKVMKKVIDNIIDEKINQVNTFCDNVQKALREN